MKRWNPSSFASDSAGASARSALATSKSRESRIATKNTHGTGCTFAAAITAGLARGQSLPDALDAAKRYITGAIAAADQLAVGEGHGPVHHFYEWWSA